MDNTCELLLRLCANADPQRDSLFTQGPSDVLNPAMCEIASGSKLSIDASKKFSRRIPMPTAIISATP